MAKRTLAYAAIAVLVVVGPVNAQSQQQQNVAARNQQRAAQDERGTETQPLAVKIISTAEPPDQAKRDQEKRAEKSNVDQWTKIFGIGAIIIGIVQVFIFGAQLIVFGFQAKRLRETIEKMDEVAAGQTADMKDSIAQASRAAVAMERVAGSLAINAEQIVQSVGTSKQIAERQKIFGEMQMRAYISVQVGAFYDQNRALNAHLQIHPMIINTGHTPAHELTFNGKIVVRSFPQGPDFDFTLPAIAPGRSITTVGPHQQTSMPFDAGVWFSDQEIAEIKAATEKRVYVYGTVTYRDAFGNDRYTNFCYSTHWSVQGQPIAVWTRLHNDST